MNTNLTQGILAMLFSSLLFALMGAEAKILSLSLPPMEVAFLRSFLMVLFLLPLCVSKPMKKPNHKKGGYIFLISRSVAGGLSFVALFYNIATITLGNATAFSQSMPLYVVVLSFLFLGEKFNIGVVISTIVGFCGILLICNPNFNAMGVENIIFGISSALFMAVAFLNLRALKDYFSSWVPVFATGVAMSVITLGISVAKIPLFAESWAMPQGIDWLHIILLGLFGTLGQHYLTKAYMSAPAGIVAPIDYMRLVFSVILGILLGDNLPNLATSFGIMLIILSGIGVGLPPLLADMKKLLHAKNTKK
ncbi:DMT family transporter [Helicobacter labetoulli]|uniref:DMT family transporter n=1 Tax=Helicobacter labetoulli TaxID=2315333 RepID=UPI000EF71934|nr:DMT family transporter [Helicobacter labetoulli]